MNMIKYLLILLFVEVVIGGHYLVWLPSLSKSVKIGFMEIANSLGELYYKRLILNHLCSTLCISNEGSQGYCCHAIQK